MTRLIYHHWRHSYGQYLKYLRIFHLSGGAGIGGPWVDSAWSVAVASSASVETAASAVAAVASASAAAVTPSGVAAAGSLAALLAGLGGRTGCARVLLREVPLDQSLPFDSSLAR